MSDICSVCSKKCTIEKNVSCSACRNHYHPACVNLLPTDIEFIREQKGNKWQCPACLQEGRKHRSGSVSSISSKSRGNVSQEKHLSQDQFERLFAEISSVKVMQQSIMQDIQSVKNAQDQLSSELRIRYGKLEDSIKSCNTVLEEHTAVLTKHSTTIAELDTRLERIETNLSSVALGDEPARNSPPHLRQAGSLDRHSNNIPELDVIMSEINERQKRARNVVIFGVEENGGRDDKGRKLADIEFVNGLMSFLEVEPGVSKVSRIGNSSENKRRPLKVTFQSESDVLSVIRATVKLRGANDYRNVFISFDRTPKQLSQYKVVKEQLDLRKAAGEQNLKIRYVSGTPTIVRLN